MFTQRPISLIGKVLLRSLREERILQDVGSHPHGPPTQSVRPGTPQAISFECLAQSARWCQTVPAPRSLLRLPSSHAAPESSWGFVCITPARSCSPPVGLPRDKLRVRPDHTMADTVMGVLHTVRFYLDRYQPKRAPTRCIPSPTSGPWVERGESVSCPRSQGPASELPRSVGSPSAQANRCSEIVPSIVGRDESRTKRDEDALLFRHPDQREMRPDTQRTGDNVVPSPFVRQA
jgi:hypothetical protein